MFMPNPWNTLQPIEIVSLSLEEIPGTQIHCNRPYTVTTNNDTFKEIINRIDTPNIHTKSEIIDPAAFAGLASRVIAPSATPLGTVPMPYGWNQKRYTFTLVAMQRLNVFGGNGEIKKFVVTGYTEYAERSYTGAISDEMFFYVNNIEVLQPVTYLVNNMQYHSEKTLESYQILNGKVVNDYFADPTTNSVQRTEDYSHYMKIRPQDVAMNIQGDVLSRTTAAFGMDYENGGGFNPHGFAQMPLGANPFDKNYSDDRTQLSYEDSVGSNRHNNESDHFLSSVLRSYTAAKESYDRTNNPDSLISNDIGVTIYDKMARNAGIRDGRIEDNPFFLAMARASSSFVNSNGTFFSLKTLQRVDPQIQQKTTFSTFDLSTNIGFVNPFDCCAHNGSTAEHVKATMVYYKISSIAKELNFKTLNIAATTMTATPEAIFVEGNTQYIVQDQIKINAYTIIKKRLYDFLLEIGYGHAFITVQINFDADRLSYVNIAIDGRNSIPFTFASHCDGLFVPVLSSTKSAADALSHDVNTMLDMVVPITWSV